MPRNNDDLNATSNIQRVTTLEDKIEKCYSAERYENFQTAVEKIISRYLKSIVGWSVFLWLITLLASMLLEKVFKIF